jgi:magnesium transporter
MGQQASLPTDRESTYLASYAYHEPGEMPGTLVIDDDSKLPNIFLIEYNTDRAQGIHLPTPEDAVPYLLNATTTSWFDVNGLGSETILRRLGDTFRLHPLVLEGVVNVPQRPKVEEYDDNQLVFITHMVYPKQEGRGFITEEEAEFDTFEPIRQRIHQNKGKIRNQGADYLLYALTDSILEGYFPILEQYGEYMEDLQEQILAKPDRYKLQEIHDIKRELLHLRRSLWPQREALNTLVRVKHPLISKTTRVHLQSCYDSCVQLLDMLETYRELASNLMDIYLSSLGNRTNEVMRVLTVISTIFVGVYGMNFEYMPELKWRFGYFSCWLIMATIGISLVYFFWRRGWLVDAEG